MLERFPLYFFIAGTRRTAAPDHRIGDGSRHGQPPRLGAWVGLQQLSEAVPCHADPDPASPAKQRCCRNQLAWIHDLDCNPESGRNAKSLAKNGVRDMAQPWLLTRRRPGLPAAAAARSQWPPWSGVRQV